MMEEKICSLAEGPIGTLRQACGLSPDEGTSLRTEPIFTAFPESFEGRAQNAGWPAPHRVDTGRETPPAESSVWAPDGDRLPLVYITFGTIATTSPEAVPLYQVAVAAVAKLPVRALLTTGRGFDVATLGAIPSNVRVEAWVPQAEVLPHTAVLVCHGGSGTMLGGLRAGLPQVVIPLSADQPQNAQRIAAIGAGLALTTPDAKTLGAAIQRVLDDTSFRRAARAVADEMATLPSVDDAVGVLLELGAN